MTDKMPDNCKTTIIKIAERDNKKYLVDMNTELCEEAKIQNENEIIIADGKVTNANDLVNNFKSASVVISPDANIMKNQPYDEASTVASSESSEAPTVVSDTDSQPEPEIGRIEGVNDDENFKTIEEKKEAERLVAENPETDKSVVETASLASDDTRKEVAAVDLQNPPPRQPNPYDRIEPENDDEARKNDLKNIINREAKSRGFDTNEVDGGKKSRIMLMKKAKQNK